MGARTPKGVLLVGPSGTGKTLLARAVAGEAGVPFFSMAGSEFMEMLVGVGASRVRDLFDTAKKHSPSIIFIDEIDAIGRMRGLGAAGGHDEREQTLNQILVEMDGFNPNDNVVVLAATNRGDLLDPALTRPGRFDRRVQLDLPDIEERKRVLKIHAEDKPIDPTVSWDRLARRTVGFSGADLENTLNEAAIQAAREIRKMITWEDLEEAATKVKMGPSKKRLQSELERRMTAYHEAGHALVAHVLPRTDSVHRVSIVSRGNALGYTMTPPEQDKYQRTKNELVEEMAVMMGGREAEDLIFSELTAGASSDISQATRIARAMVVDLGMSDLGPIYLGPQYETTEWGKAMFEPSKVSDKVQSKVDDQISRFLTQATELARNILIKHRKKLDAIAEALVKQETLDGDEFERVVGVPKARLAEVKA
jgi:cell division protease FtsH